MFKEVTAPARVHLLQFTLLKPKRVAFYCMFALGRGIPSEFGVHKYLM